jgi:nucleotide-binding universal stress UspA family protein
MGTGLMESEGRASVGPVVVGIDGSELAARAVPVAAALARVRGAALVVVRVAPKARGADLFGVALDDHPRAREEAEAELRHVVHATHAAFPDLDVRHVLAEGSPSHELLRVQEEVRASLVVVTSHGRTALARSFRGSVTEDVVRGARHPILVLWPWALPDVGRGRTPGEAFASAELPGRRVLVPLDGSARTLHAVGEAFRFARSVGGSILLATVLDVTSKSEQAARILEQAVSRALRDRAAVIERAGVPCRAEVVLATEPAEAIVGLATREGCDVIAMTTHARGALGRFLLGGVASRVQAQASRPVILVPPHAEEWSGTSDLPSAVRALAHAEGGTATQ